MTHNFHHNFQQYFGYSEFRPGQKQVMNHLLNGDSAAADFQPGVARLSMLIYSFKTQQTPSQIISRI